MSRTAEIRQLAGQNPQIALEKISQLLLDLFDIHAKEVQINSDQYSLNSLNGYFQSEGEQYFFKFHQEDNEEGMSGEYYRACILADAGLPVDQAVSMSTLPGEQMLIYRRRHDPRMSDVLRELDFAAIPKRFAMAVAAEQELSQKIASVYLKTLHPVKVEDVEAEPIHRLFYQRMVDAPESFSPGGRFYSFYIDKDFQFPGLTLSWRELSTKQFVINGQAYRQTLGDLFAAAMERYRPTALADAGGVVAHGDAHNANVWFTERNGRANLTFFDPAFAGANVPALLAEVKATFHNVFAHPLWLYEPKLASARYWIQGQVIGNQLHVSTDWDLTDIRRELLRVKAQYVWRPLLAQLATEQMLPDDWQSVIRLGLFLSPTLVMNLRAGAATHTPQSSLLGLAVSVMVGSPPCTGSDIVTNFFEMITPT